MDDNLEFKILMVVRESHFGDYARTSDVSRGSQLGLPDTDADGFFTWHPANQSASSGALTIR